MSIKFFLVALVASSLTAYAAPIAADSAIEKRGYHGTGTWFTPGMEGNCGHESTSSDLIVALPTSNYDKGKHCGKKIQIKSEGQTKEATVVDSCPSCKSGDLDMSPSLFKHFASLGKGEIPVQWEFV